MAKEIHIIQPNIDQEEIIKLGELMERSFWQRLEDLIEEKIPPEEIHGSVMLDRPDDEVIKRLEASLGCQLDEEPVYSKILNSGSRESLYQTRHPRVLVSIIDTGNDPQPQPGKSPKSRWSLTVVKFGTKSLSPEWEKKLFHPQK